MGSWEGLLKTTSRILCQPPNTPASCFHPGEGHGSGKSTLPCGWLRWDGVVMTTTIFLSAYPVFYTCPYLINFRDGWSSILHYYSLFRHRGRNWISEVVEWHRVDSNSGLLFPDPVLSVREIAFQLCLRCWHDEGGRGGSRTYVLPQIEQIHFIWLIYRFCL